MTYNVFGGTLNLAQPEEQYHANTSCGGATLLFVCKLQYSMLSVFCCVTNISCW